ncbi:MAG: polysaccharide biosynthesis tyrosine autokinase [Bacteroidales bacterium]|nr:polysaccharide biosynthesis tyrosine autokinase [Bacteroidales bacterium]
MKSIITEVLHYWYLFVISMVIFLGIALLYYRYTAPVYNVGLELLINTSDNNRNRNIRPEDFLEGFQLVQHTKTIENEMVLLQSLPLIKEVIKNMNLKVSYYYKENYVPYRYWPFYNYPNLILREMYGNVPFEIVLDDQHPQPVKVYFYIKIINDKEFSVNFDAKNVEIYDYQKNMAIDKINRLSLSTKANFGDTIQGPYFSFRVLLNSKYNKQFENKDLYFSFQDLGILTQIYQSRLTVEQSTLESSVVDIYFKGQNIQKAQDFLDELAKTYIQRDLTKKTYLVETTIEYIDRELGNIATSLNLAEGQLQYFKKQYQVMDIDQKNQQLSQYIQTLENRKNEMMQTLRFYKELYKYFEENKNSSNMLAPSSMGVNDPVLNTMIQQLATYNTEKNTLEEKNLQRNPRYKTLTNQIKDLRNSISRNISFYIRSTRSTLDEISTNIDRYKFQESQLPQTQTQLLGYERKFKLNNDIYNFLLQKRAEAQIAKASILPDSEIIEPATYGGISSPKKLFVFGFAFFMAFLLPGGFLFMKSYFNNRISGPDDIKSLTDITIVGKILHNHHKTVNVLADYPASPVSESFRSLRTNLNLILGEKTRQVILVTSSTGQEGKTFISFNLAVSLSLLNKKTILISFDLRKEGNLYNIFDNRGKTGLTDYFINNLAIQDIIHKTDIKNMEIIFSGSPPPNPAELIEAARTVDLFKYLKTKYDYIIIDTPPVGPVTDAYLLMRHSDLTLFVVRQNFTATKALLYNLEELEQMKSQVLNLVLNDTQSDDMRYGYKHHYAHYAPKQGKR